VDKAIADLFQSLKDRNLYDRALIIVTSDHGEEFADHGRYVHDQVYEELSHVPLLIRFPMGEHAGARVDSLVQLADVYPTVLDVLGFPVPDGLDGRSLLPLVRGESWAQRPLFVKHGRQDAVRLDSLKLVRKQERGTAFELYDLDTDRREQHNLIDTRPQDAEVLKEELERFFDAESEGWHFRFSNDRTPWQARVTVRTDDWIEEAGFYEAFQFKPLENGVGKHEVVLTVLLGPDIPYTEVVVRTASPRASINLVVDADAPFGLPGATGSQPSTSFSAVFDSTDESMPHSPPPLPADTSVPVLSLWCGEPTSGRTPAKPATEKDQEALRALGYL
jgi:hypothetical protein